MTEQVHSKTDRLVMLESNGYHIEVGDPNLVNCGQAGISVFGLEAESRVS